MAAAGLLTLSVRRGVARRLPLQTFRRSLGDTVRGPLITDVAANLKVAGEFFTKPPVSYPMYKQQCVSLRPIAVGAVTLGCVLALIVNPPKSSHWTTFGPGGWMSYIKGCFVNSSPPLFLTKKLDSTTDTRDIVNSHVHRQQSKESGGLLGALPAAKAAPTQEEPGNVASVAESKSKGSAKGSVTATFGPGDIGLAANWQLGLVRKVFASSQAEKAGARVGLRISTIDGEDYTQSLLDEKIAGKKDYKVVFVVA